MISNYNVLGVSAINAGTQIMVAFGPVFFAMMTGINIFTVQYYARKEYDQLKHLVGVALTLMIAVSKSEEKEVMVKVAINLINQEN